MRPYYTYIATNVLGLTRKDLYFMPVCVFYDMIRVRENSLPEQKQE